MVPVPAKEPTEPVGRARVRRPASPSLLVGLLPPVAGGAASRGAAFPAGRRERFYVAAPATSRTWAARRDRPSRKGARSRATPSTGSPATAPRPGPGPPSSGPPGRSTRGSRRKSTALPAGLSPAAKPPGERQHPRAHGGGAHQHEPDGLRQARQARGRHTDGVWGHPGGGLRGGGFRSEPRGGSQRGQGHGGHGGHEGQQEARRPQPAVAVSARLPGVELHQSPAWRAALRGRSGRRAVTRRVGRRPGRRCGTRGKGQRGRERAAQQGREIAPPREPRRTRQRSHQ